MTPSNGSPIAIAAGLIKHADHLPKGLPPLVHHITFGSFTLEARTGNPEPRYWFDQKTQSSINAIGLDNQGLEAFLRDDLPKLLWIKEYGCRVRVSLAPLKVSDLKKMIELLWKYYKVASQIDDIEINAACPNHRDDAGKLHDVLAHDPVALRGLMEETLREPPCAMAIKIAPKMKRPSLNVVVDLSIKHGFTSIVSGNTLLASSVIDGKERLSRPFGGIGGAILLPDAVQQVNILRDIIGVRDKFLTMKPSLIACGGVMSADDARQHWNAGADGPIQVATFFAEYGEKGIRDLVQQLV